MPSIVVKPLLTMIIINAAETLFDHDRTMIARCQPVITIIKYCQPSFEHHLYDSMHYIVIAHINHCRQLPTIVQP